MKIYTQTTLALIFFANLSSCNANETEISSERFCELYAKPVGTMVYSKYIGSNNGKAYIELHEMSSLNAKNWSVTKFWSDEKKVKQTCSLSEGK